MKKKMREFMFKRLFLFLVATMAVGVGQAQYDGTGAFTKITSEAELTDGYYVIAESGDAFAMSNAHTGSLFPEVAITPSGGSLTNPDVGIVWYIENEGTGRSIFNEETGEYAAYTGSGNSIQVATTATENSALWNFQYSGGEFEVSNLEATDRVIRYNSGSPRFVCYATSFGTNLSLFRLESPGAPPAVDLGEDIGICGDEFPITIDAGNEGAEFLWSPGGETTQTLSISDFGTYSVTVTTENGTDIDEIEIIEFCPTAPFETYTGAGIFTKISSEFELTDGYYVVAEANSDFAMSNAHTGTFLPNEAITLDDGLVINPNLGIVWLIQTDGSGRTIYSDDSEKFVSYTAPSSGSGNNVQIVDDVVADNQRWDFNLNDDSDWVVSNIAVSERNLQYNAGAPRFACYTSNQRKLALYKFTPAGDDAPPLVSLGEDIDLCADEFPVTLDAGNEGATFAWSPGGETTQTISVSDFGTYSVTVTNDFGSATDEILISEGCACADDAPALDPLIKRIDFETEGGYSTSDPEFADGGDFFTRTDGSNLPGSYEVNNIQGSSYFAAQDIDGGVDISLPVNLTFDADITSYTDLNFKILLAEDDASSDDDWDASDYVRITYSVDGGAPQNLLWVQNDGSTFNSAPFIDTDFDGIGDGAEITDTFQEFSVPIPETGSTIEFTIEFSLDSGDEDIAIDDIRLEGTPPAAANFFAQSFETPGGYTTSVPEFSDGFGDFFTRTNGSGFDSYAVTGADGDFYFAGQDLDGNGDDLYLTLNIENINIAGYTAMEFKVLLASYLNGWDNADYVRFFYKIDDGEPQNLLWLANAGTGFNTPAYTDLDFDGLGDCTQLTSTFQEFSVPIEEEGNFMEIYVEFQLNSGNEDIAIDNIRLDGIFQGGGNDEEDPVASCVEPNTLVVELDENGDAEIEASDINDGSSDNVAIASLDIDQTTFTCADLGNVDITLTVTDLADNTDQCTTTIEVVDLIMPELSADGLVEVSLDENGEAAITEATFNGSASDNCGSVTTEISPSTLTCADITTETNFAGDLIISEYVEGSSNNKYIEIFNGTGEAKDLNNYSLKFYFNGNTTANSGGAGSNLGVAGTLQNGETAVFKNGSASIYEGESFTLGSLSFNGDDAVELVNDLTGETLDIFGEIGVDPGSEWSANGNGTQDRTLRRLPNVINGNTVNGSGFPTLGTEWAGFDQDDVSGLGSHESEAGGGTPVTYTATDASGNTTEKTVLVIVKDELAPTFESCPENITQSGEVLLNGAVVNFSLPVSDNCTEEVVVTQTTGLASGEIFPIGTTTNTFEATDESGNTATCSFDVTVEEIVPYASFELTPSTTEPALCDEFTVMVAVQTTDVINLAEVQLSFDTEALEVLSVNAPGGGELPAAPLSSQAEDIVLDNENGIVSYAAFSLSMPYPNSDFDFVEITFKALGSSGETTIEPILNGFPKSLIAITNPFLPVPTPIDLLTGANSVAVTLQPDDTAPIAICNDEVTVYLDENGEALITPEQVDNGSFDACTGVELSLDQSIFNCDYLPEIGGLSLDPGAIGNSTVTLTVTDEAGNLATCTADVIVLDEIAPDAVCENITVELDELGQATIDSEMLDGGSTDNCETLSFEASQTTFDCEDLGENEVELTVTDGSGNASTCMATVTVVDELAPVTPTLEAVTGECEATAIAPTTTDNCAGEVTGTTTDPTTYTEQGEYTITWTFADENGNTSTAEQAVIVNDVTAPEEPTLANVTGECEATATAPTTTDNCEGEVTGTTTDPTTYIEQGEYTITWTFDDGNGNASTADQTVIVDDVTAPEVPTLADVTGECEATANAPTTTDNCAGEVTGTTTDPTTYTEQGEHVITWTFDDGNGNASTADQTVIVDDVTAPEVPTLADVTGECEATATAPTTTDNCAGEVTGTTTDPINYTEQGEYTITWTFADGNGNTSTADQTVIVDDVTAPEVPTLADVAGECEATATAPTTTDNCEGEVTGTTTDPITYTEQGTHIITWTFADGNGNTSTAEQTVIVNDVTTPEVPTLADVTGECEATATAPTATDNCADGVTGTTTDATTYTEQGEYTITWTFHDGNGNTSTAEQTVIVADETDPEIACAEDDFRSVNQANDTYEVSGGEFDATATDNCSAESEIEITHNAIDIDGVIAGPNNNSLDGWQLPVGTHSVEFTATDAAMNESQCTVVIEVELMKITGNAIINLECTPLSVRLQVYEAGTATLLGTFEGDIDSNGDFEADLSGIADGEYDLYAKVEGYLQQEFIGIDISGNGADISLTNVIPGDIAGGSDVYRDNRVDGVDLSLLLFHYNTQMGDANFNAICDLNCDGQVDGLDLSLLTFFYETDGEAPTE